MRILSRPFVWLHYDDVRLRIALTRKGWNEAEIEDYRYLPVVFSFWILEEVMMRSNSQPANKNVSIVLLGVGQVGRALLRLIAGRNENTRDDAVINVVGIADSRAALIDDDHLSTQTLAEALTIKEEGGTLEQMRNASSPSELASALAPGTILVDVTASNDTGPLLEEALARGCGIVLANKRPLATAWSDAEAFFLHPYVRYEATVGAGLPVISTLRNLLSCGDSFVSIKGVLSGTLGYMCSQMERGASYSQALLSARDLGYTEPDPREDLLGTDVLRKALILARSASWPLETDDIDVKPMFPDSLSDMTVDEFFQEIHTLDEDYARQVSEAKKAGRSLRYVASINRTEASVGLEQVDKDGPFGILSGAQNCVIFRTSFYDEMPIAISGPGAGPLVTAAGVLGDILDLGVHMKEHS